MFHTYIYIYTHVCVCVFVCVCVCVCVCVDDKARQRVDQLGKPRYRDQYFRTFSVGTTPSKERERARASLALLVY